MYEVVQLRYNIITNDYVCLPLSVTFADTSPGGEARDKWRRMMRCAHCGADLAPGDHYCKNCGKILR